MRKNLLKIVAGLLAVATLSACQPSFIYYVGDSTSDSPQAEVNSAVYSYLDEEPAIMAYRKVAESRGWSSESIARWEPFVSAVARRESGYCYNLRRGGQVAGQGVGCVILRQGKGSDSGFGQLISIHYRPGAWLCVEEGLCSADDIIRTPWNSMTAMVALIERSGRQPWCYTPKLRAGTVCRTAPRGLPG